MPSKWRRLRLQQGLPPLLFQYSWTSHGYELYMTDLTYIWSEQLSHMEILKRAEEDVATIDPSEDMQQFKVLLEKIEEALRGDRGQTTLNGGAHADSLEMTTTTKLPAPLKPLKWTLYLSKEPPSSSTHHLLLPLLRDEVDWESRQRSLLEQLKQKDWVLSKLFDKIETLGVDLGTVFPGAAGLRTARKGTTLSEAAKFIKGVAPFDAQAWLDEINKSSPDRPGFAANLLQEMSASDSIPNLERLKPPRDKWWANLPARPETPAAIALSAEQETNDRKHEQVSRSTSKKPQPKAVRQEDIETDAETTAGSEDELFERQETPPGLKPKDARATVSSPRAKTTKKSASPRLPTEADEAIATESEPEPAPAPQRRRTQSKSPPEKPAVPQTLPREPPKKPRGGLGTIGGKKKKEKEQPHPSPPPAPAPTSLQIPESSKPVEHDHSPVAGLTSTVATPPARKPTKLGMIGGKSKTKPSTRAEPTPPAPGPALPSSADRVSSSSTRPIKAEQDDVPDSSETTSLKKMGVDEVPTRSALPSAQPSAVSAPPPETEEERADRKREELKRQLEAKSKAPAKKKRRF